MDQTLEDITTQLHSKVSEAQAFYAQQTGDPEQAAMLVEALKILVAPFVDADATPASVESYRAAREAAADVLGVDSRDIAWFFVASALAAMSFVPMSTREIREVAAAMRAH